MKVAVKVPQLPDSVTEASITLWHKKEGDYVTAGEILADIETDKVILEVPAPENGVIVEQQVQPEDGKIFSGGEPLCYIDTQQSDNKAQSASEVKASPNQSDASVEDANTVATATPNSATSNQDNSIKAMPAAIKTAADNNVELKEIKGTGRDARILKEDVLNNLSNINNNSRIEERVAMSRLRQKIAERLLQSQQTNAILTTFNEVNMQPIMSLRSKYKDVFEKKHGVKLGFMSFFVKAVVHACKEFPVLNASIDGSDVVYHGYMDIGIAVSSPRGLVVPILRNAENMSISEIELAIVDYAKKAKDGKLDLDAITGGTFSITNGGTFGSMMSTPIINPPQSAILGMHAIKERAMVENGQIVARPMMYLALSYDHRLIDGREAVSALVLIKEALEDPARLLLNI